MRYSLSLWMDQTSAKHRGSSESGLLDLITISITLLLFTIAPSFNIITIAVVICLIRTPCFFSVTVYNCTMLAKDCSHCEALNKTRFNCGWRSNTSRCGYNDKDFAATECPAPTITNVCCNFLLTLIKVALCTT